MKNVANNCIWLILDILQTQMPSINDLMIEVIEKEMSHVNEFKLTVIVSMFRMISKVCFYVLLIFTQIFFFFILLSYILII